VTALAVVDLLVYIGCLVTLLRSVKFNLFKSVL
jgi:hypothetical protein